jgi:hypothetical protein
LTFSFITNTELQKKQLQTGFLAGMERILGIQVDARARKATAAAYRSIDLQLAEINADARADTQAADLQSQDEGEEGIRARGRYTRMYWEMVNEADTDGLVSELFS